MSTPADWATLLPWLLDYVLAHREILLLAPLGFAGAFIYGITGFGSALVTIPIGSMFVPLPFTLPGAAALVQGIAFAPSSATGNPSFATTDGCLLLFQ